MHHPRTRHRVNRRPRCAATSVVRPSDHRGGQPEWTVVVTDLLLPGEVAHIQVDALGWRWEQADVGHDRRVFLLGGPVGMVITGIASVVANRRARRRAERAAAPAWRPLGSLVIIATNRRLLVWNQDAWWSVWYSAIVAIRSDEGPDEIELHFAADPPYRLSAPDLGRLKGVVTLAVGSLTRNEGSAPVR